MKKSKTLFMLPTILLFLFACAFPIIKILVDVKNVVNIYLSVFSIIYLLVLILLVIIILIEVLYLINLLYTKIEMKLVYKILWTLLLISFNVLIIPYFYMKFVTKEEKILLKSLLYLVPATLCTCILIFGLNSYNDSMTIIKAERKKIEEERNVYNTKDNNVSFTFRHGYEVKSVGEYDLYVQNKAKNVVFSSFTYETFKYEQKSVDDFINRGITDISKEKESFDLYKEKEVIELDDKKITTLEYLGKTKTSSLCIYKISVIEYKDKPDYLVYVVEVITKNNYELYKKELLEILKTSKKN